MSKTFFLEQTVINCPYCKYDDKTVQGGANKTVGDRLRLTYYCFRCTKTWHEVYVFLEIEEEKESKNVQTENSGGDGTCG